MDKIISISEDTKEKLSIQAIKKRISLKKYIELLLEKLAKNKIKIND